MKIPVHQCYLFMFKNKPTIWYATYYVYFVIWDKNVWTNQYFKHYTNCLKKLKELNTKQINLSMISILYLYVNLYLNNIKHAYDKAWVCFEIINVLSS